MLSKYLLQDLWQITQFISLFHFWVNLNLFNNFKVQILFLHTELSQDNSHIQSSHQLLVQLA